MEGCNLGSWSDFREKIANIREKYPERQILFRGQSDSSWELETTLERAANYSFSDESYLHLAGRYREEIESLTGKHWELTPLQDTKAERLPLLDVTVPGYPYLVYLRHHDFPSPLLDWTESPYIAAYFAYCGEPNKKSSPEFVSVFVYVEKPCNIKVSGPCNISVHGPAVVADARHFAQKAWYTVARKGMGTSAQFCPHEDVFRNKPNGDQDVLIKLNLPLGDRKRALRELEECNINHFTLFQSEDSLIRTMSMREFVIDSH
ncbi:MAG: FRG domain-containing protein [Candidatus Hydrogenedentales bacterium]|jgi:hypothetical protein